MARPHDPLRSWRRFVRWEMVSRNCVLLLLAIGLVAGAGITPSSAQTRVGEAVVVQNEVVRVAASASTPINVGDGLLRDETVRTGLASAARLVMADNTTNPPWTFAATCAAAAGLCAVSDFADASPATTPPVDDPTGMLCGR